MSPCLSRRVEEMPASGIRRFFDVANEMKGQVLSLSIGEPDFATPWGIVDAGITALEKGWTHYSPNAGYQELREEISRYIDRRFLHRYAPEDEILVTVGGSEAIDLVFRAILNPGDEVIIPEPAFVSYKACAHLVMAKAVTLNLKMEDDFRLTAEGLRSVLTEKTRLLVVSFPNNPTGAVMSMADWEPIAQLLQAYPEVVVVSDELYAELDYSKSKPASLLQFPELRDRVLHIGGFSKAYAMTGWRLGYACGPNWLIEGMNKIHQYAIMCSPTMAQMAGVVALRSHDRDVEKMKAAYNRRRKLLLRALKEMGLALFTPLGAFYAFPSIAEFGLSSLEFCERLLREEHVAIIPGSAFGASGEGFVRISYATDEETIYEAMQRLQRFVTKLRREQHA